MIQLQHYFQNRKVSGHVFVLGGIDFTSFYDFSIEFWNCYENVVFFLIF